MEGRIDPPSSLHRLTLQDIAAQAAGGGVLVVGDSDHAPQACLFLTPKTDCLYVGKLAVASTARGKGYAAALLAEAAREAARLGLPGLRLQTRVELTENHSFFAHLGFTRTCATAHPGYTRATSYTYERAVS
ncbi:GNAT family N-acetyltransferase [Pseudoruegeria sp. SHC-113]|nr:GNAT family N-acetyltransferase [Pseudoruegeria sp. SHC-113]